jgi:hypothetical protein
VRRPRDAGPVPHEADGVAPHLAVLLEARRATEDTIRAYDTKAQIAGVGMILSVNAFLTLGTILLPARMAPPMWLGFALCLALLGCVALFGWVLWPSPPRLVAAPETAARLRHSFYLDTRGGATLDRYVRALRETDWPLEIAGEVVKLASIRDAKSRRFTRALGAAALFYVVLAATGAVMLGRMSLR